MRLLGIDVGERRIGVAAGDTESSIAVPVGVVERVGTDADFDAVLQYATSREAEAIVAGMPLTLRGAVGPQAESVARFVEELRRRTPLFVTTVDERLTTVEAERRMRESPRSTRRGRVSAIPQRGPRRGCRDAHLAVVLGRATEALIASIGLPHSCATCKTHRA